MICKDAGTETSLDRALRLTEGYDRALLGGGNALAWSHTDEFIKQVSAEVAIWVEVPSAGLGRGHR